jgi:hypothetical protein
MTLPTIPGSSISLNQIQTEFGGSNPISISEYYAGGSYVGSGTANATSVAIPTSGAISFSNFSGASAIQTYYSGTITQTYYTYSSSGAYSTTYNYGFVGPGQGSASPTTLTTGATLYSWYDYFYYVGGNLIDSFSQLIDRFLYSSNISLFLFTQNQFLDEIMNRSNGEFFYLLIILNFSFKTFTKS